jgi:acyltransferase
MEDTSGRQVWIDVARGLGIALVVAGHTGIPPLAAKCLCAFHMPLFFFLSGLLYKHRPIAETIARRARALVVPYFAFSLFGFLIYNGVIAGCWQGFGHYGRELLGILYGTPGGPYELTVFPLWFLLSLFLAHVMFALVLLVSNGRPMRAAVLVSALATLGFLNSKTLCLAAPWSVASSLIGILFLALGYACRGLVSRIETIPVHRKLIVATLTGIVVLVTALMNEPVIMAYGSYGTIPLFLPGAISGILMIILLSMVIERWHQVTTMRWRAAAARMALGISLAVPTQALLYLGRNTLTILAMHVPAAALAAHWLAGVSTLSNPVLNDLLGKVLTGLLLLTSIELFKRCPLVIPRKSMRMAPSPL